MGTQWENEFKHVDGERPRSSHVIENFQQLPKNNIRY